MTGNVQLNRVSFLKKLLLKKSILKQVGPCQPANQDILLPFEFSGVSFSLGKGSLVHTVDKRFSILG